MFDSLFASLRNLMGGGVPYSNETSMRPSEPEARKVGRPDRGDRRQVKAGRKARRRR